MKIRVIVIYTYVHIHTVHIDNLTIDNLDFPKSPRYDATPEYLTQLDLSQLAALLHPNRLLPNTLM